MVKAKPSGKQNTFAAHNDPEYIAVSVRTQADPRNLANAFEKPIRPSRDQSLTESSIEQLEDKWKRLATAYGQNGQTFVLNLTDFEAQIGKPALSLDKLIEATLKAVRANLGA
jgi:CRISPR system Cascade subunit CasC